MNLDEILDEIVCAGGGGDEQRIEIKQLIRDVLEYVKPKRITPKDIDGESLQGSAAEHFNWAIDDLEAKAKELGL